MSQGLLPVPDIEVPAIERDERFEPAETYMFVTFYSDEDDVLTKVRIE